LSDNSKVVFVRDGIRTEIYAAPGTSVMRAATDNLVSGIVGECGGDLSCATCHVYVDPTWSDRVGPPTTVELDMLEATSEEPTQDSRLSCQLICSSDTDGLVVEIPDSQ
jgi:ferredoxin, 2Fe-2S